MRKKSPASRFTFVKAMDRSSGSGPPALVRSQARWKSPNSPGNIGEPGVTVKRQSTAALACSEVSTRSPASASCWSPIRPTGLSPTVNVPANKSGDFGARFFRVTSRMASLALISSGSDTFTPRLARGRLSEVASM